MSRAEDGAATPRRIDRLLLADGHPLLLRGLRQPFDDERFQVVATASDGEAGEGRDARRERFVSICRDRDIQQLTWDAYMNKELVRARPLAHLRIFCKNIAHLSGLVPA